MAAPVPPPPSKPADLSKLKIRRDPPPSVRSALWRNSTIAVVAIGLLAAAYYYFRASSIPEVTVVSVMSGGGTAGADAIGGTGSTIVTANGYVVARTKASVSAKTPGRLAYLGVTEGSKVRQGEIIARLDNADFQAAVSQAEANVASAEATVIEARSDRDQRLREVNRLRDISTQNSLLVSPQELDNAASAASGAEARLNAAFARQRAAESGVQLAKANNENTIIRAPFSGTVLRKDAEVGEVVAPSVGGGLTRGAVVTIADLTTLEVEVDVNEAYISRISNGLKARITVDAYPDTAFAGAVRQVVPTADRQRATVQVKVAIIDRDPRVLPEMGAKVDFLAPDTATGQSVGAGSSGVIRIPAGAVKTDAGKSVVWIVRDSRLVRREIETGPVSGGFLEVRAGLNGGEQLLLGGVDAPKAGMKVKIAAG